METFGHHKYKSNSFVALHLNFQNSVLKISREKTGAVAVNLKTVIFNYLSLSNDFQHLLTKIFAILCVFLFSYTLYL